MILPDILYLPPDEKSFDALVLWMYGELQYKNEATAFFAESECRK
jgi:hypothetical protein